MAINKNKLKISALLLSTFVGTQILYSNCSEDVGFGASEKPSVESGDEAGLGNGTSTEPEVPLKEGEQLSAKSLHFNERTEILFVMDDSCSMSVISGEISRGLSSIQSLSFAPNTKMAVTYMSPALLDSTGKFDYSNPYYAKSLVVPGYMDLVSSETVNNFISTFDAGAQADRRAEYFPNSVCQDSWFSPDQKSSDSKNSCLQGAMQAPFYCTVFETGTLSVQQLATHFKDVNRKLFEDGSNAHVVFVSDTHDAGGGNFYGKDDPLHPKRMSTVNEVRNAILANNPNIQSLRFSGIVPLPTVNDPLLNGLNVVGGPPTAEEGSKVGSEGLNDFSYLSFIKETGGVAMHSKKDDWSVALKELIEFTETPSSVVLSFDKPASAIVSVKINGVSLPKSKYKVSADNMSIEVSYNFATNVQYDVKVVSKFVEPE